MVHENGQHNWAMSWPGNYCICCGNDDGIESAICCPNCQFDYPGKGDDWQTYVPKALLLCVEHQALTNIKCPCTKEHKI
jgi:hypothetical protein